MGAEVLVNAEAGPGVLVEDRDAATVYSIADLSEEGVLGVVGLDAALPKLITGFTRA